MDKNGELTAPQRRMIAALMTARTIGDACKEAGIGRTTLARWQKEPAFRTALNLAGGEAMSELSRALQGLASKAITTLESAMDGTDTPPAAKIRAADVVLGRLLQLRDQTELEERIAALEEQQEQRTAW